MESYTLRPNPSPHLARLRSELDAVTTAMRALSTSLDAAAWRRRPAPQRWSVAEGVAHLALTTEAYLPLMRPALAEAPADPPAGGRRREPKGTWVGRLLAWMMEPPVRARLKTSAAFVPEVVEGADDDPAALVERFVELQGELVELLAESEGRAIHRVRMGSPFDARIRYDLLSAFRIQAAHQRRHLWLMERDLGRL